MDIIGNNTEIKIGGVEHIPAKIDTGADSSSVWASGIKLREDGQLEFTLFAPESEFYTGEKLLAEDFKVKRVRSSNGAVQVRYIVPLSAMIEGRKIRVNFTLADRSQNQYPVLIGRKTLKNKFLVDVSRGERQRKPSFDNHGLEEELRRDPQGFHQKYMK